MAKMIELQNGRLKPVRNRLRGNVGHSGTRRSSYDNDIEVRKLRRLAERALLEQIEECELIGPAGRLLQPLHHRSPRRTDKRMDRRPTMVMEQPSYVGRSEFHKPTVTVKKRPAIKVFIDSDGIMRARPLDTELPLNLTGSPQGYVGYGVDGLFSEALRAGPHPLVLLDECEPLSL